MEHSIFVDSNVFIGFLNEDDALYKRALKLWDYLKKERYKVVVSNFIISEVVTVVSQRVDKKTAIEFAVTMYENEEQEVSIIRSDERIELKTLDYLRRITSKNVSFVDASILAILDICHIQKLASFDKVFQKQKGIEILM